MSGARRALDRSQVSTAFCGCPRSRWASQATLKVQPGLEGSSCKALSVSTRASEKGRPHATRADELAVPRHELNTILSTRDYRQDAACLVAVQACDDAPHGLNELTNALRTPRFVLYLGRKACPPAAPLCPQVVCGDSVLSAFAAYRALLQARIAPHADRWGRPAVEPLQTVHTLSWSDGIEAGVPVQLSAPRKDRVIRRGRWQFGDRLEHSAVLAEEV